MTFTPVTITAGGDAVTRASAATGTWRSRSCYRNSRRSSRPGGCASPVGDGSELIAELSAFEVELHAERQHDALTCARDHHGDLVIATALALWSAVGTPSGVIEVGKLENYW